MPGRIIATIRDLGPLNGSLYMVGRALQALTRGHCRLVRYTLVAQPIPSPSVFHCRPSTHSVIERVAMNDPVCSSFPRPREVIEERFRQGHTCLVAKVKGQFAGFLWLARGRYEEDEIHCCFILGEADKSVWDFDVYVEPQFRLGRTFARLWDEANSLLERENVRWSFSRISAFNSASLNAHEQFRTAHIGSMTALCLGPVQITLLPARPYVKLSWGHLGRPMLVLNAVRDNGPRQG